MGWATFWAMLLQTHLVTLGTNSAFSRRKLRRTARAARFFSVHDTKTGKIYQMNTKCTEWSKNIPILSEKLGRQVRLTLLFSNEQDTIFLHVKHN
jgi:hypothetical protein